MNFTLLRQENRAEWGDCIDQFWTWAITAAEKFLFTNVYSDEDRQDVAQAVIKEFRKNLCGGKIPGCRNEEDAQRWIWGRTVWRANTFRKKRRRENELFDRQQPPNHPDGDDGIADEPVGRAAFHLPPIGDEARLNELIAWARLMPDGFSRNEEAAYRAIEIVGLTTKEHAAEIGRQPGTVGRWLWNAKLKLGAVLELELRMFL